MVTSDSLTLLYQVCQRLENLKRLNGEAGVSEKVVAANHWNVGTVSRQQLLALLCVCTRPCGRIFKCLVWVYMRLVQGVLCTAAANAVEA